MSHTTPDSTEQYFIFRSQEQEGPFTLSQLQSMWRSGSLANSSQYWKEGLDEWQAITDLQEILDSPEASLTDDNQNLPRQETTTEQKKEKPDWNLFSFGMLVILAALIPPIGLVVGYRGLSSPARREKAIGLIAIAIIFPLGLIAFRFAHTFSQSSSSAFSQGPSSASSFTQDRRLVTFQHYERIRVGMPYSEVRSIIGSGGREVSRNQLDGVPGAAPAISTVMYQWENADGSNMNAMFQNDALIQKAQSGL